MADWPWAACSVHLDGYDLVRGASATRTALDSGLVSQKRSQGREWWTRTFRISVKVSDLADFMQWQSDAGNEFFNFRDWQDGTVRKARVVGGALSISLTRQGTDLLDGERYVQGDVTLEGYG